jgi:predicted nucleic acid-binding protein
VSTRGPVLAVDTSVAIPLLVERHLDHATVTSWLKRRAVVLSGHALPETYSVLTRLPGDLRLTPQDAARILSVRFGAPLALPGSSFARLPALLTQHAIAGGAVYDALIALAALAHDATLATRDMRARATYDALGARVEHAV